MRHDVLCAKYGFDSDPGQDKWGYEPPVRPCDCSRFAEVRRDALDAARKAVARQCGHTKSVSTNYECDHDRAIAAINALQDALQDDLSRYE